MDVKRIAKILQVDEQKVRDAVSVLETEYGADTWGLQLVQHGEKVQLVTKPALSGIAQTIIQEEMQESLTGAAAETLALIAYSGPLSRAQIDYIRGVNSSFIIRSLLMRGLIDRSQDPQRHNAYIYTMSIDLLKKLGLQSTQQLPEYASYHEYMKNFLTPPAHNDNEPNDTK